MAEQFEKNQDRLFERTKELATELAEVWKGISAGREQLGDVERRINKKFSWLYTLLIATLLGLVVNLAHDKLGFSMKSGVDEVVERAKAQKPGGIDGSKTVAAHKSLSSGGKLGGSRSP